MEVVVEDKQLSLAIGKKGQNVRLAAKLVGWRIDIKSEEEKRREVEAEMARMARAVDEVRSLEQHGLGEAVVAKLVEAGVHGLAHLAEMTDEDLAGLDGVGPNTVVKVREAAALAQADWDARDAAEAERLAAEQAAAEQAAADQAAADQAAADQAATEQAAAEQAAQAEGAEDQAAEPAAATAEGGSEEGGTDGER
jgi:N utilization substance protein A